LGKVYGGLDTFTYLPRQDTETAYSFASFIIEGDVTAYRISVSTNGTGFREVAQGDWAADHTRKFARFRPSVARYLRFEALAAVGGTAITSELNVGGLNTRPRPLS